MSIQEKVGGANHLTDFSRNLSLNQNSMDVENTKSGMSQKRLLWNLFVLSFCYFLFYTGFWCLSNLQSTMNGMDGLGDDSQALIYALSLISSLFLPDLFIAKFGAKKVLVICTLLGCPYLAANIYLRWDTMMAASALYGIINGPFVTAQAVYIEEIASRFEKTVHENIEVVMACFFGCITFFSESTNIWGNLLVYYALEPKASNQTVDNSSVEYDCGYHFKPSDANSTASSMEVTESQRLVLVGVFVILGLLSAVVTLLFLDPLGNDLKEGRGCNFVFGRFLSALKHLKNPQQLLLVPIAIYIGMEGPFYSNEITQAYIACSWGVHHVGFVTICFGVCGAIMSLLVGPLVKCISQMAVLILAACANVAICVLLFLWNPSPETTTIYFVIAGVWGMGDAIWWSQITALYGLMFPNDREAAFSNLYFWSFLGFFISYSYANYLSVAIKINILIAFLVAGIACYLAGQIKIKCTARKEYILIEDGQ